MCLAVPRSKPSQHDLQFRVLEVSGQKCAMENLDPNGQQTKGSTAILTMHCQKSLSPPPLLPLPPPPPPMFLLCLEAGLASLTLARDPDPDQDQECPVSFQCGMHLARGYAITGARQRQLSVFISQPLEHDLLKERGKCSHMVQCYFLTTALPTPVIVSGAAATSSLKGTSLTRGGRIILFQHSGSVQTCGTMRFILVCEPGILVTEDCSSPGLVSQWGLSLPSHFSLGVHHQGASQDETMMSESVHHAKPQLSLWLICQFLHSIAYIGVVAFQKSYQSREPK